MNPSKPLPYDFDLARVEAQLPSDWQLHYFAEIESTNDWALEHYRVEAATRPTFVLARLQSRGRGRSDRTWQAAAGNLTCSLAFPLVCSAGISADASQPSRLAWPVRLAIATALSVAETARDFLPEQSCQIKWPNDLLVDGRKAAGILIESCFGNANRGDPTRIQTVIVGIGININTNPTSEQAGALPQRGITPISFAEATSKRFDLTDVVAKLTSHLAHRLTAIGALGHSSFTSPSNSDDAGLLAEFNQHLAWQGHLVSIRQASEEIQGELQGLDQHGHLMILTSHGSRTFAAGELRPIE
jgi:BirA family biotin operon repressor/biotin-[acetyl-CoA-carboxylase] ligase